ncbi:MAG: phosphate ABC transporter substrate-binding protein [Planctomycetes bacterium]|nr:phosphate ABC transporter substrate-binding protein [Planctomycetota bacterium]
MNKPLPALRRASATLAALLLAGSATAAVSVDPAIPAYQPVQGVTGAVNSIGSDTLNNLMTYWAEGFNASYPAVQVQIEGKGSTTAPPALIEGTAQLGPMSREMKKEEMDKFEKKYGYKPTGIRVAIDALAVFVHKDNPLKGVTVAQVDGLFSSTFKHGGKDITDWGLLLPEWKGRAVSLYGRNSASGTYGYFKEHALKKGDFKPTVKEQPGSSAVVQGVASDLNAVGYSGIGYVTSSIKALPVGEKEGAFAEPSYDNCLNGSYPLARFLFVYVNKAPGKPMDTLTLEFIKYVLSQQGQAIVVKDGFFPVPAKVAKETIELLTK